MNKGVLGIALSATLLALCVSTEAQQGRIYRVGILGPEKLEDRPQIKGLRDGLGELGYAQGKNLQLNISNIQTYDELRPIAKG